MGMAMTLPSNVGTRNSYSLALLRIGVGILFLIFGQYKGFGTAFTLHGGFQFWINKFLDGGAYPFMVPVLRGFVLPHATSIAFLAILRRKPEPLGICALLRRIFCRARGLRLVGQRPAEKSYAR